MCENNHDGDAYNGYDDACNDYDDAYNDYDDDGYDDDGYQASSEPNLICISF